MAHSAAGPREALVEKPDADTEQEAEAVAVAQPAAATAAEALTAS